MTQENNQPTIADINYESSAARDDSSGAIVARAGSYYRNTRYVMFVVLVGMGFWFGYDGFKGWPQKNAQIAALKERRLAAARSLDRNKEQALAQQLQKLGDPKTDWDIGLQKFLSVATPVLGIFLLLRSLHNSRGECRLQDGTLHIPGHPPVPLANITEIDKRLWDRKGIAYISYDLGDGRQGTFRLDDFIYDRPPTDAIYKSIEEFVKPAAQTESTEPPPTSPAV